MGGTAEQRAAGMAEHLAAGQDEKMGRAILALYRSVAQPATAEMDRNLEVAAERPGLSILATEDHLAGSDDMRCRAAERAGAHTEVLEGLVH